MLAFQAIYNHHIDDSVDLWQTTLQIRQEDVMNGFFLYSLLLEKAERSGILAIPHDEASQKDRLQPVLAERNKLMEGIGQECYAHACDTCFIVFSDNEGRISE